jgi:hypothetical protein
MILAALFISTGFFWKIAPEIKLSDMFSMTPAEGVAAGAPQRAAGFHPRAIPAARCESCHGGLVEEWRRSHHSRSLTSDDFLRSFPEYLDSLDNQRREDPRASMACFGCHAPLLKNADARVVLQVGALVRARRKTELEGFEVGCVACHSDGSDAFSGPIRNPQKNSFHASRFSAAYKEGAYCGECHTAAPHAIPCSDVHADWGKSRAAKRGTTCQSCHMAERDGLAAAGAPRRKIHSHEFPGSRSPAMQRQAVVLRLQAAFRRDRLEATATVRNLAPHRVPDG